MAGDDGESANKPTGYRFGEFRLYPAQRRLLRGEDKVAIGSTDFKLLRYLVENSGREIGKGELRQGVWHHDALEDSTLASHMTAVRDSIGAAYIDTIFGVGYQFIGKVEPLYSLPPPVAVPAPAITLPPRSATPSGRASELAQLADLAAESRMVTVTGPGGIGKSWLAGQMAWREIDDYPGGAHWIDLAPVKDSAGVASATAKVLGVALRGSVPAINAISAWLGMRPRTLLIFDGCEYVAGPAAGFMETLLTRVPLLSILATSQEVLRVPGEKNFRLEPLTPADAEALLDALLLARDHNFRRTAKNAASLTEICRRVGGIPHALVLVAARIPVLGMEAVRTRLAGDARFRLLTTGFSTAAARQQTLLAAMEWSHGLLDPADQTVFRRLSRFSGSFTGEAAAAVAGVDGIEPGAVEDALARLVDKSLLNFEDGEPARYRLLETVQYFGLRKLGEAGEAERIADLHMGYFQTLFEPADELWETVPDADWLEPRAPDIDNIRVDLDRSLALPDLNPAGIALFGTSGRLWYMLDLVPEGREYGDKFVALIDDRTPPAVAARALRYNGSLWREADRRRAVALMERSAALYRQIGDRLNLGSILSLLGGNYAYLGRHAEAKAALDEARELLAGSTRLKSLWNVMNELGNLARLVKDTDEAVRCFGLARDLARTLKDVVRESFVLFNLGEVEFRLGAIDRAIVRVRESAEIRRASGQPSYLARSLINLASYLTLRGDHAEARTHAEAALPRLIQDGGHWQRLGLQVLALHAALAGQHAFAAQLIGWVDADYVRTDEIREPTEQALRERLAGILAASLTPDDIRVWAAEGARWSPEYAVEFTLNRILPPADPAL
jgi:predicted ATPase/DNA-binding winged helix-turn-helix (wHTH) protein